MRKGRGDACWNSSEEIQKACKDLTGACSRCAYVSEDCSFNDQVYNIATSSKGSTSALTPFAMDGAKDAKRNIKTRDSSLEMMPLCHTPATHIADKAAEGTRTKVIEGKIVNIK
jgi:hypothetical protein